MCVVGDAKLSLFQQMTVFKMDRDNTGTYKVKKRSVRVRNASKLCVLCCSNVPVALLCPEDHPGRAQSSRYNNAKGKIPLVTVVPKFLCGVFFR